MSTTKEETLHYMCFTGNTEKVKSALNAGEDFSQVDKNGYSPIHYTIMKQNLPLFKILQSHSYQTSKTSLKLSCLHLAILFDAFDFFEDLKDQKEEIDVNGDTPLLYAVRLQKNNFVIALLNSGASPTSLNKATQESPLKAAFFYGNVIAAAEIIRKGARLSSVDSALRQKKLDFVVNLQNIKSNIKILYTPQLLPGNEQIFKSLETDGEISGKSGKKIMVHSCVITQQKFFKDLSDGSLDVYVEWSYLQKSPTLEALSLVQSSKVLSELMLIETIKNYISSVVVSQKAVFPPELLKTFSNAQNRNKNIGLARYVVNSCFLNYDENRRSLHELSNEELGNIVEALQLKEIKTEKQVESEPDRYKDVVKQIVPVETKTFPMTSNNKKMCLQMLNWIIADKSVAAFMRPVDEILDGAPKYYTIIKQPMCIETIKQTLASGKYKTANGFMNDLRLVWTNGMKYNYPGTLFYTYASNLLKKSEEKWGKLPLETREEEKQQEKSKDQEIREKKARELVKETKKERMEEDQRRQKEALKVPKKKKAVELVVEDDTQKDVIRVYTYEDKVRVMEKVTKLSEEAQKMIPKIMSGDQTGEDYELDLETMSNADLTKLENFCDSYAH
ncbi:bromodomain containing protein, putative [Entamoeba invadens IP1]|uniref:Bromodomain containing protein, putative n=1 Tax=Entamoeba invadens IP1 TaxID=370355 RepID=A0A0A1UB49_ENTIV|nr:bromodomain containing protein, putative [Entamoeba invadens IP1]ELP89421.1 bromodomain containing protein, putative [Entamoeba invadens IP1]|eukprot:XP_004256192.1 bromodomain containing protein, putative [Entamoeba invadens IP1]